MCVCVCVIGESEMNEYFVAKKKKVQIGFIFFLWRLRVSESAVGLTRSFLSGNFYRFMLTRSLHFFSSLF